MSALAGVPVGSTASVRQLRVAGPGLQPRLHDKTTRRTDPAGSTLATPDFGPKDGVHLINPLSMSKLDVFTPSASANCTPLTAMSEIIMRDSRQRPSSVSSKRAYRRTFDAEVSPSMRASSTSGGPLLDPRCCPVRARSEAASAAEISAGVIGRGLVELGLAVDLEVGIGAADGGFKIT